VSIEHDLPLSIILMGEPLANYVKSLDCRCELASETRTKTGNELLLRIKYRHHIFKLNSFEISNFNLFIFRLCVWTTTKNIYSNSFVFVHVSVKLVFFEKYSKNKYGKKYLLPDYVWTHFNRNNQTFTKLRNILKEYFLKPRIGF
jgi:hypothetical protein